MRFIFLFLVISNVAHANTCLLNKLVQPKTIKNVVSNIEFKKFKDIEKAEEFIKDKKWKGYFYSYRFEPLAVELDFTTDPHNYFYFKFERDLLQAKLRRGCFFGKSEVLHLGLNEYQFKKQNPLPLRELLLDGAETGFIRGSIIDEQLRVIPVTFRISKLRFSKENNLLKFRLIWKNPLTGNTLPLYYVLKEEDKTATL